MASPRKGSMIWRAGMALIVVEAAIGLAIGAYVYRSFKQFHYDRTGAFLGQVCPALAYRYTDALGGHDAQSSQAFAARDSEQTGLRITVVALDGEVLADSARAGEAMENHRDREEIAQALAEGAGSSIRYSATLRREMFYFALRVDDDGQPLGVVRVATPLEQVDRQLAGLLRTFVLGAAVWIGTTIVAIVFFSTRLSSAIRRLGTSARRFADGDFDHRLADPPGKEFEPLVGAFNSMAEQLNDHITRLKAQQREHVAILRSMDSGVIAVDPQQRVLRLNQAAEAMLGATDAGARGRTLEDIGGPPELIRHAADALQTHRATTEELRFDEHGQLVVRVASSVLREPDGRAVGLLLVLTDITKLRKLESLRSDFAANVSHELRTPITNIRGYAETLLEADPTESAQTRRFLEVIARNAARLDTIVEDLLTLARLEREEFQSALDVATTPLSRVVTTVLNDLADRAKDKDIAFRTEFDERLYAKINERLVEQALSNLLTNALRHSPDAATITVSTNGIAMDDGTPAVQIVVADQGPGIAPEHLPRLFERFYRVRGGDEPDHGGTGLGLAIVKHIALVHGGTVHVDSEIGRGARFRILLPEG